jgi:hypothetical protein
MRASFDTGRPVPDIPGMMSSPAIMELSSSQYAPATSFSPMTVAHDSSYSLTALSMAAEYQALQGNMTNEGAVHHKMPTPPTLQTATMDVSFDGSHAPGLEESLDSLTSFLDNEPLNSYHFATLMSAEQPM